MSSVRMPVETRSLRDRSAVGRFPTVTLGFGEDTDEENEQPEGNNVQEENPCKLWLRKVCPCCRPKPEDDKTEPLVPGPEEPSKEDGIDNVTPVTDNNELDGNWDLEKSTIIINTRPMDRLDSPSLFLVLQNSFSGCSQ